MKYFVLSVSNYLLLVNSIKYETTTKDNKVNPTKYFLTLEVDYVNPDQDTVAQLI